MSARTATTTDPSVPPDAAHPPHYARWSLVVLAVTLAIGGWLRFANLGALSFWADEYPHAIAGRSLIHEGRPVLPSGRQYRRALAQTVVVAASMRAFGEDESAARLPSALIGLVTIAAVWVVTRRRFSEPAALAAAAAIAVMPLHVAHSRSARFYAAFALAYAAGGVLATRAVETRSRRAAAAALASFAVAMHLQIEAATLLVPVLCYALYLWSRSPGHRDALRRVAAGLAGAGVAAVLLIIAIPPLRDGVTWLVDNLPGLELEPGLHLENLGRLFGVVSWWAWIAVAPAAIVGVRRAGASGVALMLQLLVPALLLAILFKPTSARGISSRYLFYLLPFMATLIGVAVAEIVRGAALLAGRRSQQGTVAAASAALLAALVIAGGPGVWRLPGAGHPGRVIPRPNWNAATSIIGAEVRPDDALLSTTPLATAWRLGRCADWIRVREAAEKFLDESGGDIYCRSQLVPDAQALDAFFSEHPRGWVIADPGQWASIVDPEVRAIIERTAARVATPDRTILLWRWGA